MYPYLVRNNEENPVKMFRFEIPSQNEAGMWGAVNIGIAIIGIMFSFKVQRKDINIYEVTAGEFDQWMTEYEEHLRDEY